MNRPTFVPRINFLITSITEVGFTGGGGGGSTVQGRGRGIYNAGVGRGGSIVQLPLKHRVKMRLNIIKSPSFLK